MSLIERASDDVLREVLNHCKINWIMLLSETSYHMNVRVADVINIHRKEGRLWWERKLREDFDDKKTTTYSIGDIIIQGVDLRGREPNEAYLFLSAPLDTVIGYAIQQDVPWMLVAATEGIGDWDRRHHRSEWVIRSGRLETFIRMSESPIQELRDLAKREQIHGMFDVMRLIGMGRIDLAQEAASSVAAYDSATSVGSGLSSLAASYDKTQDARILEVIKAVMKSNRYDQWSNGPAIAGAARDASLAVLEVILSSAKRVGRKVSGIEYSDGQALLNAVKRGDVEIARALIAAGANPASTKGKAFREAVVKKDYEMMKLLSDQNAFKNARVKKREAAVTSGNARELLDSLVKSGKVVLE